jgi:hypothetical protein
MNNTLSLKAYKRGTSLNSTKWHMASLTTHLAEKKDTDGAFCLVEANLAKGNEPPPHMHSREDELFYVLEGRVRCVRGRSRLQSREGRMRFSSETSAARICHSLASDSVTHIVHSGGIGRCLSEPELACEESRTADRGPYLCEV